MQPECFSRLGKTLSGGREPLPIYCLYGEESFLIEEALALVKENIVPESLRDFNLDVFYGQEEDLSKVCDTVETLPMMSTKRLVIVKDFQEIREKDSERLQSLIDNPVSTTVLLLTATKIDKRRKIFKKIDEAEGLFEFKRPYENQVPYWIGYIASKFNLQLAESVKAMLLQLAGANLMELHSEVRKLHLYLGDRREVREDDVLQVISRARLDSVFDLTNAIGENDRVRALVSLANLLEQGQSEIGILAMVARHVRLLKSVQDGMANGLSSSQLSSQLGISPFFIKKYVEQSRQWTTAKIEKTFRALLETDKALKSSPLSSHIWLENFILRTCA